MNKIDILLLPLLIGSLIMNFILIINNIRLKVFFDKLFIESDKLQKLLSNSTTNINELFSENKNLRNQVETLKKNKITLLTVNKGDKVICKQNLMKKKSNHSFEVLFECNVIESTEKKLKLSAFDFKSDDDWANKEKPSIIAFFQDKWVDRSECDIIMDEQHLRASKLRDLLSE